MRVAPSPVFGRRSDGNLEVRVPITIPEAINGATVEVPTLDGTKRIRVPAGTQHGTIQRLRGEGPPRPGGRGRRDIHYRLEIEVPNDLSRAGRRAVEDLAKALNGHDPRERILSAAGKKPTGAEREDGGGIVSPTRRTTTTVRVDSNRGVFMISVAAELAEMHPQTLRMYEARGLITPKRSPKNTRLYSQDDVDRLRRIQQMTAEEGLNLAGVETVLEMEAELERTRLEVAKLREKAAALEAEMAKEIDRIKRSGEIVPYGKYDAEGFERAAAPKR